MGLDDRDYMRGRATAKQALGGGQGNAFKPGNHTFNNGNGRWDHQ